MVFTDSPAPPPSRLRPTLLRLAVFGSTLAATACGGAPSEPEWPPTAQKWFDRAEHSYGTGDLDDAALAADNALKALPNEPRVRMLAARVALAELEFDRALQLTRGLGGTDAASIRGRAYWYSGQVEKAADELDVLLADPEVRDPWARQVSGLARQGRGRTPFEMSGGLLAVMDMPRVGSTAMLVPVEVNGEPSLAMIATDTAEAVIHSPDGESGSWVSLRFGERVEVSDVPALGKDLSGLSRQLNAPVKMLIGVNLLRHLHATVDFVGSQFVVRSFEPPPPPFATTLHPGYFRGGAMVVPAAFSIEQGAPHAALMVHTSMTHPLALDAGGWEKAGVPESEFTPIPGGGGLRAATVPMLRLGAFEIPGVPGVAGAPIAEVEKALDVDIDGFAGSGLLASFRVTIADGGKTMWLEDLPPEVMQNLAPQEAPPVQPVPESSLRPERAPAGQPESAPSETAPAQPASGMPAPASPAPAPTTPPKP